MKTFFLTSIFILLSLFSVYATQWTISNDPTRPAQFESLQAAYDAASPGDTLLLAGSTNSYVGITMTKPLTLMGEGMNNPDGFNTVIAYSYPSYVTLKLQNIGNGQSASGSRFEGIHFQGDYVRMEGNFSGSTPGVNNLLEDIHFERCFFQYAPRFVNGMFDNIRLLNCLLPYGISFQAQGPYTNVLVSNCVFSGNSSTISGPGANYPFNGGVTVSNCLFLDRTNDAFNSSSSYSVHGIVVQNSIFYKAEPTGAQNAIFNNNITYLCNNNTLPYGNNTGNNNQENANPFFTDYPALGGPFSWEHDYSLQQGSPALLSGINSTNIGLTGGAYPLQNLKGNSRTPIVTEISMPNSSVPLNGTLQGNIKARVRD